MYHILNTHGYPLTCRGTIEVKGKGSMETYFLDGHAKHPPETHIIVNPLANINNIDRRISLQCDKSVSSSSVLGTISEKF